MLNKTLVGLVSLPPLRHVPEFQVWCSSTSFVPSLHPQYTHFFNRKFGSEYICNRRPLHAKHCLHPSTNCVICLSSLPTPPMNHIPHLLPNRMEHFDFKSQHWLRRHLLLLVVAHNSFGELAFEPPYLCSVFLTFQLKPMSPSYIVVSWSPSTTPQYKLVSSAPYNFLTQPSTTSSTYSWRVAILHIEGHIFPFTPIYQPHGHPCPHPTSIASIQFMKRLGYHPHTFTITSPLKILK